MLLMKEEQMKFQWSLERVSPKGVFNSLITTEELNHYVSAFNDRPRRLLELSNKTNPCMVLA